MFYWAGGGGSKKEKLCYIYNLCITPMRYTLKVNKGQRSESADQARALLGGGWEDFIYLDEGKAPHWDDRNGLNESNLHSPNEARADALHSKKYSASVTSLKLTTKQKIIWVCGVMLACSVQADIRPRSIFQLGLKKWAYQNLYEEPYTHISLKSWIIY